MGMKITGLKELQKGLVKSTNLNGVRRVVQQNGSELQRKAQTKAAVDTGTMKRSIGLELSDGGLTATVEPTAEYAAYVEYGTRFMESAPYVRPAFREQKAQFKRDLEKLVK